MEKPNNHWKHHWKRKIDPEDVLLIRELRDEGLELHVIAEKFEITKSHVCKIVNMKTWTHIV